jgi:nanoRNase/pAp phosphatase (c-di-AMP/oligoRNAs hydrolase)
MAKETISRELADLGRILEGRKELLVAVHNNPDPDAMASAMALGYLAEQRYGLKASIAYGGNIGRSENQAMVRILKINMKEINRIDFKKYDRIALVDTQPKSGNHSLPEDVQCHIVIDHHPAHGRPCVDLAVIKPDIGVTATMLIEWLRASDVEIPANVATALAYAMISETQHLGREASQRDIEAYLHVYVKSSIRKLAGIINPKLPHDYFVTLAKALQQTVTYRNLMCSHLGNIESAEIVSEMADFLLRHKQIGWALCTGRFKKNLIISIRTSNEKANAGKLIHKLVRNPKNVGGHGMIAGGYIPFEGNNKASLREIENQLTQDFARIMKYKDADWKPLIESNEQARK